MNTKYPTMLDNADKIILNRIQSDFPVTPRPYRTIAQETGFSETDVIQRITRLKDNGTIRRIGANFFPEKLGFTSTLCAAKVPEDKIDIFTKIVNEHSGVTHNYQRNHSFNVWFTFIAQSIEIIESNIKQISEKTGVTNIINLQATEVFKIKAHFDLNRIS